MLEPNEQTYIRSMVEELFPSIQTTLVDSQVTTALASTASAIDQWVIRTIRSQRRRGNVVVSVMAHPLREGASDRP